MQNDLIFDLGMHRGEDSEYYLRKGFRVVAVEANPQLVAMVQERLSSWIAEGRLTIVNVGIAAERGEMPFYVNKKQDDWSSFIAAYGQRDGAYSVETIRTVPLADLLDEYGTPYYLKVDIEGHDEAAVVSLMQSQHRPRYVSVEATVPNFWRRMHEVGYTGFKYINQRWHQKLPPISPPKEGQFTDMATTGHMSGPFGEETYGPWLTVDELDEERRILYDAAFGGHADPLVRVAKSRQHLECGVPVELMLPPWYDWHAKLG